jgi:dihydrodiol dehydrogenase / D-xylose 1-dehydrogenase (NADP)
MWTRFFPAVVELRRLITTEAIGEVKLVKASFGFKRNDTSGNSRLDNPELGGGAVLDVGVYVISFATMIFGERPESIHATGWLTSTGVDVFAAITLKYSGERVAQLTCSIGVDLVCEAVVFGTKGKLKLPHPFWSSTKLETPNVLICFLHEIRPNLWVYLNSPCLLVYCL